MLAEEIRIRIYNKKNLKNKYLITIRGFFFTLIIIGIIIV